MSRRQTRLGLGAAQTHAQTPGTEAGHKAPKREKQPIPEDNDEPPSGVLLREERLTGVPRLAVSLPELMAMRLDHRAGFLVSLVDGTYTLEMILDACAMSRDEALAILGNLVAQRIIVID
jgi:hypothetical protein